MIVKSDADNRGLRQIRYARAHRRDCAECSSALTNGRKAGPLNTCRLDDFVRPSPAMQIIGEGPASQAGVSRRHATKPVSHVVSQMEPATCLFKCSAIVILYPENLAEAEHRVRVETCDL